MDKFIKYIFIALFLFCNVAYSQNETKKWYFGANAGLDFITSPPTILTNGAMSTVEGCASISDAAGNLLFYTNGINVWDQTHSIMANGGGMNGSPSSTQTGAILKQPGNSNLYYIFSQQGPNVVGGGCYYSVVDMSLAGGNGSVTIKNASLYQPSCEKIVATKHCNGIDFWIITRDNNTQNFRVFLLTSSGVSSSVVLSPASSAVNVSGFTGAIGYLKVSPNGRKLANAVWNNSLAYEIYDFDNSTGLISNPIPLGAGLGYGYGCEFSPDGTKFYGSCPYNLGNVYQWDLCAGSATAIAASISTVQGSSASKGAFQLAPDGKIYICRLTQQVLAVINNPNLPGSSCGYVELGQSVSPKSSQYGLPNFITSALKTPSPPFTFTVNNSYGCQAAAFTMPPAVNTSTIFGCAAAGYSVVGQTWFFGDPASGSTNTSFLANPIHAYTTLGTYTAMLVINYSCGGGTDTIKQQVVINQPCISVTSTSITCAHLGSATVAATGGVGPYSYTWMPSAQTNSVATGLSPGTYTLTVFDFGNNFTYTATAVFTSSVPLTGSLNNSSSVSCNGANTATASVTGLAGGSGTVTYAWFNTTTSYTNPAPLLSAGLWSVTVSDVLTGCQINQSFYITQPPPMNLVLSSNTPTSCTGGSVTLTGINSAGTPHAVGPAYSYSWTGGPTTAAWVVNRGLAATYIYTLTSKDSLNCAITATIAIDFISHPLLSVSNVSICPLETATLSVSGASTYTWNNSINGSTFTDNPLTTSQYTVVGSAFSCTSLATASIILKPVPVPLLNSNSPVCNGQNLNLFGNGGVSYSWTGPLGYSSSVQYPVLSGAAPSNSGVYNLTVTAANTCTASITKTITVNPTPTLTALGSTVCVNQTLNLFANSFIGSTFFWSGPGSYTSSLQNPFILSPPLSASGTYSVKVTSSLGCTNTAACDVTVTAMPVPSITSTSPKCFGSVLNFTGSGGVSYLWTGPNGFSSVLQNPLINGVTLPAAGVYTLQVSTGPCVNTATHSVVIYALPAFTISSNTPVCETKNLSLFTGGVSNAVSYAWHGPAGFVSPNQFSGRDSCKLAYSGVYSLTVVDFHNCQNTGTYTVSVNQNPTLIPLSSTVCLNQPATLKVSGAATYVWSGPNFYYSNQANAFISSATSPAPTIYTVVGTAANQCTSIATASLSTLILPLPGLSVFPGTRLCINKTFTLQGFGGETYDWYGPDRIQYAGQSVSINANSPLYNGTYTLVVGDAKGCQASTLTLLTIDPLPGGSIVGNKMQGCVPFSSDFKFLPGNGTSGSTVKSSWVINSNTYQGESFTVPFTSPGIYTLTGTLTDTIHSCMNTVSNVIEVYPLPKANFEYSPEVPVEDEQVLFTNTSKGEEQQKWNWYFKTNKVDSSKQEHPIYSYPESGLYPVALVVKNKWGCADSTVKLIKIDPDLTMYIPNAFTPNGDGLNDVFLPVLRGIKTYNLAIFNRWGTKLFETNDLATGWPGVFNDQPCSNDVYSWKMSVSAINGKMKTLTGTVMLNR